MAITNKIVNDGLRPTLPSSLFAVGWVLFLLLLFLVHFPPPSARASPR